MTRSERIFEGLRKRGWYPARWAHHPPAVKRKLRSFRWRPQVKQCFANCQRFVLDNATSPDPLDDVEYHEGWVLALIPIAHAWLTVGGEVVDLTLEPDDDREIIASNHYTVDQVRHAVVSHGHFGPVDQRALNHASPWEAARRMREVG